MSRHDRAIRTVYSLCLVIGGISHWLDISAGGWLPYRFAPLPFNGYWTLLALADPLAALLLWHPNSRVRWAAALGIMVSDVAINIYARLYLFDLPLFAISLQSTFLAFVVLTIRHLRPD